MSYQPEAQGSSGGVGEAAVGRQPQHFGRYTQVAASSSSKASPPPPPLRSEALMPGLGRSTTSVASSSLGNPPTLADVTATSGAAPWQYQSGGSGAPPGPSNSGCALRPPTHQQHTVQPSNGPTTWYGSTSGPTLASTSSSFAAGVAVSQGVGSGAVQLGGSSSHAHWRGAGDRHRRTGSGQSTGGGGLSGSRHAGPSPSSSSRHQTTSQQQRPHTVRFAAAAPPPENARLSSFPEATLTISTCAPSMGLDSRGVSTSTSWPPVEPPTAAVSGGGVPSFPAQVSSGSRRGGGSNGVAMSTCPTSSTATAGVPMAPAPPPPAATSSCAPAVAGLLRPNGEERPTVALSQNIMSVYEAINTLFYRERELLLTAPAKYAVRKSEDAMGHYVSYPGEEIAERYVVKEVIGKGSFGTVLRCIDLKYNETVAVKVIRSGSYFEHQGWFEAQVVAHLNSDVALQNLVVQLRKVFLWKGHMVLVFEPLSFSLYRLITLTKYNGVSLDLTRKFAYQMIKVLLVLEQHQPPIIHCDLKPENVLLRDPSRSEVRVIDFGSACYQQQAEWTPPPMQVRLPPSSPSPSPGPPWDTVADDHGVTADSGGTVLSMRAVEGSGAPPTTGPGGDDASCPAQGEEGAVAADKGRHSAEVVMPKYIQSRYYRSPEVILELGYTTAIDRWSLGCFLVEMHTGVPLFPGKNEADMVAFFTSILGPLPDYMIAASPKREQLYHTCSAKDEDGSGDRGGGGTSTMRDGVDPHQRPQRGVAVTAPPPSMRLPLTPFTEAPGHAVGSPFFLRTARVECQGAAGQGRSGGDGESDGGAGADCGSSGAVTSSLEDILGVDKGGPRSCRAGQPGHDPAAYSVFCDFIHRLLQYDPRKRMSCEQAIQHPFLEPIRALKSRPLGSPASAEPRAGGGGSSSGEGAA